MLPSKKWNKVYKKVVKINNIPTLQVHFRINPNMGIWHKILFCTCGKLIVPMLLTKIEAGEK